MRWFLIVLMFWGSFGYSANSTGSFETEDLIGTTTHHNGTVGTTPVAVPAVAGNIISELLIKCLLQTPKTKKCFISFDGGTNFFTVNQGEVIGWTAKGEIDQVHVKGNEAGVDYEIILNREDW